MIPNARLSRLALLAALVGLAVVAGLATGSADMVGNGSHNYFWQWLTGHPDTTARTLVLDLRLPRVAAAAAAGALLALAGSLNQVLTRNPLADPYVLGVAGGAAVASLSALLLGLGAAFTPLAAMLGATFSSALVFGLARRGGSRDGKLLLTGVMLASVWGALTALLLALAPPGALPGMVYWHMGDLSAAASPVPALLGIVLLFMLVLPQARSVDVLGRGETVAASLGVEVPRLQTLLFLAACAATGLAVATAGTLGFIGLAAPHIARRVMGTNHRWVLPAAALCGALLVVLADLVARLALAPMQLPTGAVTALIGAPYFLYLLYHRP